MKKTYIEPNVQLVKLHGTDIIMTSTQSLSILGGEGNTVDDMSYVE